TPSFPVCFPVLCQDPEVQRHAAEILWNMLRQGEAECQHLQEMLLREPRAEVEEQLERARRRLSQLQLKVLQEHQGAADLGFQPVVGEGPWSLPGFAQDPQEGEAALESSEGSGRPQIIGPEEEWEPGCANNESDSLFQDLGLLKARPAHLAVFLRFLFSQADPTPLLFHLCSEVCCQLSSPRQARALARDVWGIFLERNA
ncbi:ARHGB factor, partial [Sitta europaea]|nr:ARHGB factor [Sitta europaea]